MIPRHQILNMVKRESAAGFALSIRAKLTGVFALLIAVISIFIYFFFPTIIEDQSTQFIAEKARSVTEITAFNIASALYFGDVESLEDGLDGVRHIEDIVYILVLNNDNEVISAYHEVAADRENYRDISKKDDISLDDPLLRLMVPIRLNESEIGKLYIGFSLKTVQEEIQHARNIVSVISVALFLIGLLCVLAISTLLTGPLHQMVRTTYRIAGGDMSHRVDISSKDELGILATSFNKMIDGLESAYTRIVQANEQLSMQIAERERAEMIQSVLFQISEATNTVGNIGEIFELVHRQLGRLIDTRNFYIALYHEDRDLYSFEYCVDECDVVTGYERLVNSLTDYVRRTGKSLMVDEQVFRQLEEEHHVIVKGTPSAQWLGAPLRTTNRVIGVVAVQSYSDPSVYAEKDLELLDYVSTHIAMAIERKQAEEEIRKSEERYRDLFENASDLILIARPDGRLAYVNKAWRNTLGYNETTSRNLSLFDIVHMDDMARYQEVFQKTLDGEDIEHIETNFVARNGRIISVEGSLNCRVEDNSPVSVRGIFRDISDRKKIDRMKDEFISVVSHELRTPLTSIHGSLSIMSNGLAGEIPPKARNLVDIAKRNSVRLGNLVNDLLDFQKIESGKMEFRFETIPLKDLLEQSIEDNRSYADQFHVEFVMEDVLPEAKINVDRDRLLQVMANLLSNAAKFSPPRSQVEISVCRNNDGVRVSVRDHGPGIPEQYREKIFQKFSQVDSSRTREKGGTGLGLSIAKSIVEKLGGEIGFESKLDEGTTFYFDLPELREQ